MSLKSHTIKKLDRIFSDNNWNYTEDESSEYADLYNKFSEMLSHLSEEEQGVVLDLTADFKYFPFSRYSPLLAKSLSKMPKVYFSCFEHNYIVPLKIPKNIYVVKSDSTLLYPCLHTIKRKYPESSIDAYPNLDILKETFKTRKKSLIIFVDDFVGTGKTATDTFDSYFKDYYVSDDEVIVISLVAQERGIKAINDYGIEIYNAITIRRGISDSDNFDNKENALSIVDAIERKLRVVKKYRRGYKESEALVSLVRTPNNTFPLFWYKTKINNQNWPAPFYR